MKNNPKILVGCPTSFHKEYCLKEYAAAVKSLTFKDYDVLLVDNSKDEVYIRRLQKEGLRAVKGPWHEGAKQRIIESRNLLREKFLEKNYDYLLSLEQDIIPPKDVIERLLESGKEIISAVYFMPQRNALIPMLAINEGGEKYGYLPFNYVDKNNYIININYAGLGAVLISRKVLEKIRFRADEKPGFDDWFFCKDAERAGFKIYADLSVKCKHLLNKRPWNWSQIKL